MKNFIAPGDTIQIPSMPYATTGGDGVQVGKLFGVSCDNYSSGGTGQIKTSGIHALAKTTGAAEVGAFGALLYWSSANKKITLATGGNVLIGILVQSTMANADTSANVRLGALGGVSLA